MKQEDSSRLSEAKPDRYHRFVRWSDEDQCYIGYCPDLYYGGCCHGDREEDTYADLCAIVREEITYRSAKGELLPGPLDRSRLDPPGNQEHKRPDSARHATPDSGSEPGRAFF